MYLLGAIERRIFLPLSVFSLKKFTVGAFVVQKNMTGDVVLELVLLRGEKVSSHAHQMEYFYLLGVPLRISDKHPHPPLGHNVQTIYSFFFFIPPSKREYI